MKDWDVEDGVLVLPPDRLSRFSRWLSHLLMSLGAFRSPPPAISAGTASSAPTSDRRIRVPISDLAFVVLMPTEDSWVDESTIWRWWVGVVPDRELRARLGETLADARATLASRARRDPALPEAIAEAWDVLEILTTASPIQVGRGDAATVWRLGEELARTLNLPLLDLGGPPRLRRADQLDMPLGPLLARDAGSLPHLGPPPPILTHSGLRLSWNRREPEVWLFGTLALSFGIFSLLLLSLGSSDFRMSLVLSCALLLSLLLAAAAYMVAIGSGQQCLVLNGPRLSYTAFRTAKVLRAERIRAIWETDMNHVVIVADDDVLRVRLPSAKAARWFHLRIEAHLAELAKA